MDTDKYIIIPERVYSNHVLTNAEKIIFGIINSHAQGKNGFCWLSNKRISQLTCITEKTVVNSIKKLTQEGFIAVDYTYYTNTNAIKQRQIYISEEEW